MYIYISPKEDQEIIAKQDILMKDLATIIATDKKIESAIENMLVMKVAPGDDRHFLIRAIDLYGLIEKKYPAILIQNIGAEKTIIRYIDSPEKPSTLRVAMKVFLISMVLLVGASTAIMTFHSDSELPVVFENYYYLFFDKRVDTPLLLDLPYSIGLTLGIMVFFNHFNLKDAADDPTPIEVEMAVYESEVRDTLIDGIEKEEAHETGKEKSG